MTRKRDPSGTDDSTVVAPDPSARLSGLCLVVLTGSQLQSHSLPARGAVVIGRSADCDVRVADPSISRTHARLLMGSPVQLEDLSSANGTRVGDRELAPSQPVALPVGGAFELGAVTMLLQRRPQQRRTHRVWPHGYFDGRVDDECVRARQSQATFGVGAIRFSESPGAHQINEAFATFLSPTDVVGEYDAGCYEVLVLDVSPETARRRLDQLSQELAQLGMAVDTSLACFPRDGSSAAALIAAAFAGLPGAARPDGEAAGGDEIVLQSPAMVRLHQLVAQVATGDISVLLLGETGVGKEIIASRVHRLSRRAAGRFVRINCAALSPSLLESELFGHEKGSFTGAVAAKPGLLESAGGGTVFLDEVGEMPLAVQVKLLRVLEERKVLRVGGLEPRAVDARFVSATNRDLEAEVDAGRFRQDLYYRLAGATVEIPPLRERLEEVEPLIRSFARLFSPAGAARPAEVSPEALALMRAYAWPGNIRELRNVVERAVLLSHGGTIRPEHLPLEKMRATHSSHAPEPGPSPASPALGDEKTPPPVLNQWWEDGGEERERQQILDALATAGGNQTKAAKLLGVSRRTLINRLDKYGIARPRKRPDSGR